MIGHDISGFVWDDASASCAHEYLFPALRFVLGELPLPPARKRLLDLGCGNGSLTARLHELGWSVVGVDPSAQGIAHAKMQHPTLDFCQMSAYEDLHLRLGKFPVVISFEVIEHVYSPREYVARAFEVLDDDGVLILSTPYHGYWKNLMLALTGRFDQHFTALWDHGHIKFWSIATISRLLSEATFDVDRVLRVGRVPPLAKSMLVVASKRRRR
jgi:2-polyprenyl-6-hydroxyphenyl methylase/3-demethylubiquinone-9 3-methyltransferase